MRIQPVLVLAILCVNNALALKGLKQNGSLRLLQNGPPVASTPEDSPPTVPKEGTPKVVEPKKDPKGDAVSKDKKGKKCKKANKTTTPPPPKSGTEVRQMQNEAVGGPMNEEEYCLQGDATEAECQAAMAGQLPKGHQRIKADVKVDISYNIDSTSSEVVNQVGQILKSKTAADFIGCDDKKRRLAEEATGADNSTSVQEVRVTGVDFKNLKTDSQGACASMSEGSACEAISSNVEIHYVGEPVSTSDQEEMFAILIATIKAQAASGDFSEIGTIENVEVSSEISSANGGGSNIAQTAGIPTGVVGAFLVVLGGVVIGYCMMRGRDDEHHESNNAEADQRGDVIEAEAVAVIDDEEKESKWKFNPSKFL